MWQATPSSSRGTKPTSRKPASRRSCAGTTPEPREHVDQAMRVMLQEAEKWANMVQDRDLRDVGLIASAQRIEHYGFCRKLEV